jgi:hypothetical protein
VSTPAPIQRGYLLLADISGYTPFVANAELEHAHEILSDLLETICAALESLLVIHKLEGDAVFAYAPQDRIRRGELLLEVIEATYAAFRDRQDAVRRATTCTCAACTNLPDLDLKFIAHHGEFILQQLSRARELVGSDVNLVHRLLKNRVVDSTGWRAYALFTQPCLDHLSLQFEQACVQTEKYEHLGEVLTHSIDLRARLESLRSARRVVVEPAAADVVLQVDFPTPAPLTWEWLLEPARRNLWSGGRHWRAGARPGGRTGVGASNHCAHGTSSTTEVVLDWRPFDYATLETHENGIHRVTETIALTALQSGGTRVTDSIIVRLPLPRWLRVPAAHLIMKGLFKYHRLLAQAARLAGKDFAEGSA